MKEKCLRKKHNDQIDKEITSALIGIRGLLLSAVVLTDGFL